jgi:uncharacterized lipoprotein YehR (DUF1307 family)
MKLLLAIVVAISLSCCDKKVNIVTYNRDSKQNITITDIDGNVIVIKQCAEKKRGYIDSYPVDTIEITIDEDIDSLILISLSYDYTRVYAGSDVITSK